MSWLMIYRLLSPRTTYQVVKHLQPWCLMIFITLFLLGLLDGLYVAPQDYQQGDVYRIMFIHVPAAIWSLGVYMLMATAAFSYLVWRAKIADMFAKASAPVGMMFTFLALITGAIWGKPTWGTWWIWDARLTSELILLFIYAGIIALRNAMPEAHLGARASAMLTLIGVVNIPIIHYSVDWWQTLHQGASILQLSAPSIAGSMLRPLLVMIVAFFFYYLTVVLCKLQAELLWREQQASWVQKQVMI